MQRPSVLAFLAPVLALGLAAEAQAQIQTPAGLKPGDQFRIVFVTSTTRDATSNSIADYDAFVTTSAAGGGLDTYDNQRVTWQAIGSTATVTAKSRLPDSSPALYLPTGQKVAASGKDLWSGDVALAQPINRDEQGRPVAADTWVFTGGNWSGAPNPGVVNAGALGTPDATGRPNVTMGKVNSGNKNERWSGYARVSTDKNAFLGISSVLTVPGGN